MKKLLLQGVHPLTIILIAVILRLLPHIPNVSPIAAMALFGGAYLNKRYALIVPLIAMFLSDVFLGFSLITPFVYGGFLIIGMLGLLVRKHKSVQTVIVASLLASFLFFVITNFAVWAVWNFYPKTIAGLWACYVAALPFFRNTVLGDLFYVGLFFGGYELVMRVFVKKSTALV